MTIKSPAYSPDVLLIGGGIMSATLGVLLKTLRPTLTVALLESLKRVGCESSNAWNNAGTGHAALCELNYTPLLADGSIDIAKAITINVAFERSREFWAWLVEHHLVPSPKSFINPVPHMSFGRGVDGVRFLRKRVELLRQHHAFQDMQYTEDRHRIAEWAPLIMEGRASDEPIAMTRSDSGTDVDFGALTRMLVDHLSRQEGVAVLLRHRATGLRRAADGKSWLVRYRSPQGTGQLSARFVFLGAGGAALSLLQKSGIPEGKVYAGFPISGQWLVCDNPSLAERHRAKVYGQAAVNAPPMSVPHLDTRWIEGKKALLFGPFAGFSTKFLRQGSWLDLPRSIKASNLIPMLAAARDNVDLVRYLLGQLVLSCRDRLQTLREFMPSAAMADWHLATAGQRVQIIKKDSQKGGVLQFGTEVVVSTDGSMAALLGASPGASTAVTSMLEIIERCFPEQLRTAEWQARLREMISSYGQSLAKDALLYNRVHARTRDVLGLTLG